MVRNILLCSEVVWLWFIPPYLYHPYIQSMAIIYYSAVWYKGVGFIAPVVPWVVGLSCSVTGTLGSSINYFEELWDECKVLLFCQHLTFWVSLLSHSTPLSLSLSISVCMSVSLLFLYMCRCVFVSLLLHSAVISCQVANLSIFLSYHFPDFHLFLDFLPIPSQSHSPPVFPPSHPCSGIFQFQYSSTIDLFSEEVVVYLSS